MLRKTMGSNGERYGVYYVVFGSLAGYDRLVKEYLWSGPYEELKTAVNQAQDLSRSHQNDNSFVVRKYQDET